MNQPRLLEVSDWRVEFPTPGGDLRAVDGVSFHLDPGETLGIVGESGSGKSTTAMSLFGLVDSPPASVAGEIRFDGSDIRGLADAPMRAVRGRRVGFIFQDPTSALNPVLTVGQQIREAVWAHRRDAEDAELLAESHRLLEMVGLNPAERRYHQYPFELSGGMRQRVVVAMAIANQPDLLIADEPTTALDVTIQAQIIELLEAAKQATGAATIFISHDLGLVGQVSDRVAVMYAGRIVESGPTRKVFADPQHPYTIGLLACHPDVRHRVRRLPTIPGAPPQLSGGSHGCSFQPRCGVGHQEPRCTQITPELSNNGEGRLVACHFPQKSAESAPDPSQRADGSQRAPATEPLLVLSGVSARYTIDDGGEKQIFTAVDGVDLTINRGETLGLVGESGCGKSTLARTILQLHPPSEGAIMFAGEDLTGRTRRMLRPYRRRMQMVFQNPFSSLNPKLSVGAILEEPLRVHGQTRKQARERRGELLSLVGLQPSDGSRFPHQFSGGQRQRIAIARALALEPELLILDEAVSALDVSIQAQILNLLADLQDQLGHSYLFISHDLGAVGQISDRIAVMYSGRVVEEGHRDVILRRPRHPYTEALLRAVPSVDNEGALAVLGGSPPNPLDPPMGCRFHTRCPFATDLCTADQPRLSTVGDDPGRVACHFPLGASV